MVMQTLLNWDISLFYSINHFQHPLLDIFFLWISEFHTSSWILFIILATFLSHRKDRWIITFASILLLISADLLADFILKPLFHRTRPCHVLRDMFLLYSYCPNSFSFPSSHAMNIFAIAIFLGRFYPHISGFLGALTVLMSLSRIYIGVHYPLDILGGAVFGMLMSLIWIVLLKRSIQMASITKSV